MSKVHKQVHVFKSFLTVHEQLEITNEILTCHLQNEKDQCLVPLRDELESSPRSIKLNTGVTIGGSIASTLPKAEKVCRRVFQRAASTPVRHYWDEGEVQSPKNHPLHALAQPETALTGTALLYGPNASMKPHYDSPTQPKQKEEWLCILSVGLTMVFRCDSKTICINSGDAMVMDSMAVLHGVEEILPDPDGCVNSSWRQVGLPAASRLGLVVWQGRTLEAATTTSPDSSVSDEAMEGMGALFEECEDL
jgi:hypothetical protein